MPTKAQLEAQIKDLQQQIKSMTAERGIFHTELLKLAIQEQFKPLLEFLNPTPEEIKDIYILIHCEEIEE